MPSMPRAGNRPTTAITMVALLATTAVFVLPIASHDVGALSPFVSKAWYWDLNCNGHIDAVTLQFQIGSPAATSNLDDRYIRPSDWFMTYTAGGQPYPTAANGFYTGTPNFAPGQFDTSRCPDQAGAFVASQNKPTASNVANDDVFTLYFPEGLNLDGGVLNPGGTFNPAPLSYVPDSTFQARECVPFPTCTGTGNLLNSVGSSLKKFDAVPPLLMAVYGKQSDFSAVAEFNEVVGAYPAGTGTPLGCATAAPAGDPQTGCGPNAPCPGGPNPPCTGGAPPPTDFCPSGAFNVNAVSSVSGPINRAYNVFLSAAIPPTTTSFGIKVGPGQCAGPNTLYDNAGNIVIPTPAASIPMGPPTVKGIHMSEGDSSVIVDFSGPVADSLSGGLFDQLPGNDATAIFEVVASGGGLTGFKSCSVVGNCIHSSGSDRLKITANGPLPNAADIQGTAARIRIAAAKIYGYRALGTTHPATGAGTCPATAVPYPVGNTIDLCPIDDQRLAGPRPLSFWTLDTNADGCLDTIQVNWSEAMKDTSVTASLPGWAVIFPGQSTPAWIGATLGTKLTSAGGLGIQSKLPPAAAGLTDDDAVSFLTFFLPNPLNPAVLGNGLCTGSSAPWPQGNSGVLPRISYCDGFDVARTSGPGCRDATLSPRDRSTTSSGAFDPNGNPLMGGAGKIGPAACAICLDSYMYRAPTVDHAPPVLTVASTFDNGASGSLPDGYVDQMNLYFSEGVDLTTVDPTEWSAILPMTGAGSNQPGCDRSSGTVYAILGLQGSAAGANPAGSPVPLTGSFPGKLELLLQPPSTTVPAGDTACIPDVTYTGGLGGSTKYLSDVGACAEQDACRLRDIDPGSPGTGTCLTPPTSPATPAAPPFTSFTMASGPNPGASVCETDAAAPVVLPAPYGLVGTIGSNNAVIQFSEPVVGSKSIGDTTDAAGTTTVLQDTGRNFVTDGVPVGSILGILSGADAGQRSIVTAVGVPTVDKLTVSPPFLSPPGVGANYIVVYESGMCGAAGYLPLTAQDFDYSDKNSGGVTSITGVVQLDSKCRKWQLNLNAPSGGGLISSDMSPPNADCVESRVPTSSTAQGIRDNVANAPLPNTGSAPTSVGNTALPGDAPQVLCAPWSSITGPVVTQAGTVDSDHDGVVDALQLTFSTGVTDPYSNVKSGDADIGTLVTALTAGWNVCAAPSTGGFYAHNGACTGTVAAGDFRYSAFPGLLTSNKQAGTTVVASDADAVAALPLSNLCRVDVSPAGVGPEDRIYAHPGATCATVPTVAIGDFRYSPFGALVAGTPVVAADGDIGSAYQAAAMATIRSAGPGMGGSPGALDNFYADLDGSGQISVPDMRLSGYNSRFWGVTIDGQPQIVTGVVTGQAVGAGTGACAGANPSHCAPSASNAPTGARCHDSSELAPNSPNDAILFLCIEEQRDGAGNLVYNTGSAPKFSYSGSMVFDAVGGAPVGVITTPVIAVDTAPPVIVPAGVGATRLSPILLGASNDKVIAMFSEPVTGSGTSGAVAPNDFQYFDFNNGATPMCYNGASTVKGVTPPATVVGTGPEQLQLALDGPAPYSGKLTVDDIGSLATNAVGTKYPTIAFCASQPDGIRPGPSIVAKGITPAQPAYSGQTYLFADRTAPHLLDASFQDVNGDGAVDVVQARLDEAVNDVQRLPGVAVVATDPDVAAALGAQPFSGFNVCRVDVAPAGADAGDRLYAHLGACAGGLVAVGDFRYTPMPGGKPGGTPVVTGDADVTNAFDVTIPILRVPGPGAGTGAASMPTALDMIYGDVSAGLTINAGDFRYTGGWVTSPNDWVVKTTVTGTTYTLKVLKVVTGQDGTEKVGAVGTCQDSYPTTTYAAPNYVPKALVLTPDETVLPAGYTPRGAYDNVLFLCLDPNHTYTTQGTMNLGTAATGQVLYVLSTAAPSAARLQDRSSAVTIPAGLPSNVLADMPIGSPWPINDRAKPVVLNACNPLAMYPYPLAPGAWTPNTPAPPNNCVLGMQNDKRVETADLNANGKVDAMKVVFSEPVKDSTISANLGQWSLSGHSIAAFQTAATATCGAACTDDDTIYLTFTETGTSGDDGAMGRVTTLPNLPDLGYFAAGAATDLIGNSLRAVGASPNPASCLAPALQCTDERDGVAPVLHVIATEGHNIITLQFSEPVVGTASNTGLCTFSTTPDPTTYGCPIGLYDITYNNDPTTGAAPSITSFSHTAGTATVTITLDSNLNAQDLEKDRLTFAHGKILEATCYSGAATPPITQSSCYRQLAFGNDFIGLKPVSSLPPGAFAITEENALSTATAIATTWTTPSDSNLDHYEVYTSKTGPINAGNFGSAIQVPTSTSGFPTPTPGGAVHFLVPTPDTGSEYNIAVRLVNQNGQATWSNSLPATPQAPDTTPPGAVNPTKTGETDTSLTFSWTAPADDGTDAASGAVSGYKVYVSTTVIDTSDASSLSSAAVFQPSDTNLVFQQVCPGNCNDPGETQAVTIKGLLSDTTYYVEIRAYDDALPTANLSPLGTSPNGKTLCPATGSCSNLKPGIPSLPSASDGDPAHTSAHLTWTASGKDGSVGTVTGYNVCVSTDPISPTSCSGSLADAADLNFDNAPLVGPDAAEGVTVQGLVPDTDYYFGVAGLDGSQAGDFAVITAPHHTAVDPFALDNDALYALEDAFNDGLTVSNDGTANTLTWDEPQGDANHSPVGIQVWRLDDGVWTLIATFGTSDPEYIARSYTVDGTPDDQYKITTFFSDLPADGKLAGDTEPTAQWFNDLDAKSAQGNAAILGLDPTLFWVLVGVIALLLVLLVVLLVVRRRKGAAAGDEGGFEEASEEEAAIPTGEEGEAPAEMPAEAAAEPASTAAPAAAAAATAAAAAPSAAEAPRGNPEKHYVTCPKCTTEFTATGVKPLAIQCPNCGVRGTLR